MRLLQPGRDLDLLRLPSVADGQLARGKRQALGEGMGRTTMEDTLDGLPQHERVQALMLPDQQKIDEVSGARGAAAFVRPRVRVQLLSDLPLQGHQQDFYRLSETPRHR